MKTATAPRGPHRRWRRGRRCGSGKRSAQDGPHSKSKAPDRAACLHLGSRTETHDVHHTSPCP
eukprot:2015414-Heterocapsa_arctica.AAC.1